MNLIYEKDFCFLVFIVFSKLKYKYFRKLQKNFSRKHTYYEKDIKRSSSPKSVENTVVFKKAYVIFFHDAMKN